MSSDIFFYDDAICVTLRASGSLEIIIDNNEHLTDLGPDIDGRGMASVLLFDEKGKEAARELASVLLHWANGGVDEA